MLKFRRYFYIESNANKGVALCHGYIYTADRVAIVTWRPMDAGNPSPQRHERHASMDALADTFDEETTVQWYD